MALPSVLVGFPKGVVFAGVSKGAVLVGFPKGAGGPIPIEPISVRRRPLGPTPLQGPVLPALPHGGGLMTRIINGDLGLLG